MWLCAKVLLPLRNHKMNEIKPVFEFSYLNNEFVNASFLKYLHKKEFILKSFFFFKDCTIA